MFTRDRELNGVPIGSSALTKKSVEWCVLHKSSFSDRIQKREGAIGHFYGRCESSNPGYLYEKA